MATKPVGSDHNENEDRRPKVLPSITVNRGLLPDSWGILGRLRRRSPRIGEAPTEVYTFRAPPSYKSRIMQRAASDDKTESQVIRDALDAYL